MEPFQNGGPPSQKNCLAHLIFQNFGMLKLDKITSGLDQANIVFQATVCKANRTAAILTM